MKFVDGGIWKLDIGDGTSRFGWDWWWWIFFIPGKVPEKTKQLMVLWSTKECKEIFVNDYLWRRRGVQRGKEMSKFGGIVAAWYFDGDRMIMPMVLEDSNLHLSDGMIANEKGSIFFKGGKRSSVAISDGGRRFLFNIREWTDFMSEGRRKANRYLDRFGYDVFKIYGAKFEGKITEGNKTKRVSGTAHFQKVKVNIPSMPWYWGIFHSSNGSYIEYFVPYIGIPCLRRTDKEESIFNMGGISIRGNLKFFYEPTKEYFNFSNVSVRKTVENGLPLFAIVAKEKNTTLCMKLRTYSRALWDFKQPLLAGFSTKLFYNEYPTVMEEFELRDGKKTITKEDLGSVVGNTEHTWGLLF